MSVLVRGGGKRACAPVSLWLPLAALFLATAGVSSAAEYAVLASGARLRIDRHESDGLHVKLYTGAGSIEMNAAEVQAFEVEDALVPARAPDRAASASNPPAASPQELADAAAKKYGLPPKLVRSVMKAESDFRPRALSPKGAVGLMQLMPSTAGLLAADPENPAQNVDAGARYLRDLLERFHGALWHALAAYNAGPAAVEKYGGVPPFPETLNYIRRVERDWEKKD